MRAARGLYAADPLLFSAELGVLAELAASPRPALMLTVAGDHGATVGAAIRPLGYPLLTSGLLGDASAAAAAEFLAANCVYVPGLLGISSSAEVFARRWIALTQARPGVCFHETVYRLEALQTPRSVTGHARAAGPEDRALLVDWLSQFHAEAFGRPVDQNSTSAFLTQVLAAGSQFVIWHADATPVSVARLHPAVAGVARIGPVFTAPAVRGCGYGAAVTADVVARAHRVGATDVVLQTDVTNTAANTLYRRLGFVPVASSMQLMFTTSDA